MPKKNRDTFSAGDEELLGLKFERNHFRILREALNIGQLALSENATAAQEAAIRLVVSLRAQLQLIGVHLEKLQRETHQSMTEQQAQVAAATRWMLERHRKAYEKILSNLPTNLELQKQ